MGVEGEGNLGKKKKKKIAEAQRWKITSLCLKNGQKLRLAEELSLFGKISI